MLNNKRDLTDRQIEFLALGVDQVFLSVRTLNCLKNQGIERLEHLVQYSPEDLMRIQNFGRKCLSEITALFAEQNLSLGLHLPEGTTREVLERSNAKIEDVREPEASIELNATQKAFLVQPLSQYHFSVRLSNIIIREGFKRVGDLASIPFASGRRPSGLGRHTLEEIIKFLEENGLPPGIGIPNWDDALASEWEQECVAEIEQLQQHDVIVPSAVGPSPTFLEDELAQFVRFVSGNERRAQIVIRNYGFDGTGQKTLDAVGKEFGITRERVRQIGQNFTRRVSKEEESSSNISTGLCVHSTEPSCDGSYNHKTTPRTANNGRRF